MARKKEDDDQVQDGNTPKVQAGDNSVAVGEISTGGDLRGQVVIGNGNIAMHIENEGVFLNIATPPNQPLYSMRSSPVRGIPLDVPLLLDRADAQAAIKATFQTPKPVSIFGEKGIGKTSLVRYLLHHAELPTFPNDVLYVDASERGLDDLRQSLFDRFWMSPPAFKPREAELLEALQQPKALIFIDHLKLGQKETTSLRNSMPGCTFILASIDPSLPGEGQKIPLKGLPDKDAMMLFEHELASFVDVNHSLSKKEKAALEKLCVVYKGNPSRIVDAADLVALGIKSIFQLLEESERGHPDTILLQAALSPLAQNQKHMLSILAAVGGSKLPLQHLEMLSQDPDFLKTLQGLIARRLVQVHDETYSLTGNLASSFPVQESLSALEEHLVGYFTHWLESRPPQTLIEESIEALLYLQKKAMEEHQWSKVIRFGQSLEPGLILGKRWQAWADLLKQILTAAKALRDRKVEAWALHQLGSRAMYLGQEDQARQLLTQALNIRQAIHDQAGLHVTQHNLNVSLPIPVAPISGGLGGGFIGNWISSSWFIGSVVVAVAGALLIYLLSRSNVSPPLPPVPPVEFTATTSGAATVTNTFTLIPTKALTPSTGPDPEDFPLGVSPLTGLLACNSSLLEFPAVLVSISHFPAEGRPQSGLSFASMVFEMYIGTGETRFLAVYYGDCPHNNIGPSRSGRLPYEDLREVFQGSCLVFAGADDPTSRKLPVCKIVYGPDVISAFLSAADLEKVARANYRRDQDFNYTGNVFNDTAPSGELSAALSIDVIYSDKNKGQWQYNAASGKYLRSINGTTDQTANQFTPATDRLTGEQLAFSNVIVMLAEHIVVRRDAIDINMAINSFGNAYLFRDGKVFEIRWTAVNGDYEQQNGLRRPIRFTDTDGNPIPLKPGNTWIHLMSSPSKVILSGDKWEAKFSQLDEQ